MALTPEQIKGLDIASQRKLNNWAGSEQSKETDIKNLDFAYKQGYAYKPPVAEAPVVPPTPTITPTNNLNAETFKAGMTGPDIPSMLPDNTASNEALKVYNQGTLTDANQTADTLQKQIDSIKEQQIKDAQFRAKEAENAIKAREAGVQPVVDTFKENLANQSTAIKSVYTPEYYTSILNDKKNITNEIIGYSKLLDGALNDVSIPSLASVATGRKNAVIADYQARMSIKQAALSAIDGNFSLASSILENGVSKLDNYYTNQLNFQKLAQEIFKTEDVKTLTTAAIADLEAKQKTLNETKTTIQNLLSDPNTAPIVNKAGILLTDTADQVSTKLNDFYSKNPGYNPENIKANQVLIQKYGDAGINVYDTPEIVKAKLEKSALYQKDIFTNQQQMLQNGYQYDSQGNLVPIPKTGGSVSYRTNNPGNIKWGDFAQSMGATDSGIKATDGRTFAMFPDVETGTKAMAALLTSKNYINLTLDQALKRWSNNGYGAEITSIGLNTKMSEIAQYPELLNQIMEAMKKREGWTEPVGSSGNNYNKIGLLANTDYNQNNQIDKSAKSYLDYYIKNATYPTYYALFGRTTQKGGPSLADVASRAQELYYAATGTALPDVNILKETKKLITENNKILNKNVIQADTITKNFDLAIQGEMTNDVNKNATIINKILNPIYLALGDPAVNQAMVSNGTISQEFANLISIRNASGTTVADKVMSEELIKFGTSVEAQKAVVERLKAEAVNIHSALVEQNKDLYKIIDPLEVDPNNPNRQIGGDNGGRWQQGQGTQGRWQASQK